MEIPWCVALSRWEGRLLRCSLHFLCEDCWFSCPWCPDRVSIVCFYWPWWHFNSYQRFVIIHVCSCAKKFTYVLALNLQANFEFSVDSQVLVIVTPVVRPPAAWDYLTALENCRYWFGFVTLGLLKDISTGPWDYWQLRPQRGVDVVA